MAIGKKTGGRQKGTPNKVTADVKEIAQSYGEEAVKALVEIVRDGEAPHAARVSAVKELLDRGYGKAKQAVEHSGAMVYNVVTGVPDDADADD